MLVNGNNFTLLKKQKDKIKNKEKKKIKKNYKMNWKAKPHMIADFQYAVELQCLEHLWDY